jgi:NAD(P)-dependent dehydrogenase (short-subunit alcohol dehydrogenase family)
MMTLEERVVVITGAASGIGRAPAVEVARRRARVAISDIDEPGLAETVDLVKASGAREVRSDRLDVADRSAFAAYADAVAEHFGRVDVVVNNAGVALAGDVEDLEYADMEWIIGIDFWGIVHGTKEFLPT